TATSLGGDAGRLQQTTDPRGLVDKSDFDTLGRTVRTIAGFTDFVPSGGDDETVEYSYDGDGHTLTYQPDEPNGLYHQTQSVYGVTAYGGSDVNSNDLLAAVRYPDKTTGQPSSSPEDSYTVNALGQTKTASDRNGTVHTYSYDVLARQTSDAVTTLGSGV